MAVYHQLLFTATMLCSTAVQADLRIVSLEESPTNYTYDNDFTGTTTELVKKLRDQLAPNLKIEVLPAARAVNLVTNSKTPVISFTFGRTESRIEHGFHFMGPVITRRHVVWKLKSNVFSIASLDDIRNGKYAVGSVRGDWRSAFFERNNIAVDNVTEHAQNLQKLMLGRIDLWISSDIEAPSLAQASGVNQNEIEIAYAFREASSYIVFSKNTTKSEVAIWQAAFDALKKTSFFNDQAVYWSGVLGYELGFDPAKGYFVK